MRSTGSAPPSSAEPRDRFGRLRCRVRGCHALIDARTGLQELDKLIAHYRRVHLARLTMAEALELRALWERGGDSDAVRP